MIEINDLTKYYGKGESRFKALDGVSVRINDGEFIVILGASGSGKSTFLNVISGLETPDGVKIDAASTSYPLYAKGYDSGLSEKIPTCKRCLAIV